MFNRCIRMFRDSGLFRGVNVQRCLEVGLGCYDVMIRIVPSHDGDQKCLDVEQCREDG